MAALWLLAAAAPAFVQRLAPLAASKAAVVKPAASAVKSYFTYGAQARAWRRGVDWGPEYRDGWGTYGPYAGGYAGWGGGGGYYGYGGYGLGWGGYGWGGAYSD